jgi:thiosulfate/3-mercaptopyruvate sulfurtransferase
MSFTRPQHLVETDWMAKHLDDPEVRLLECNVFLHPAPDMPGGFAVESGRAKWAEGHIPGAGFVDLQEELSDRTSKLRFMMPPAEQFAEGVGRAGVGDGVRVILYDRAVNMWAARIWWMLRAFGFDNAAVLNGGFKKWTVEGRPVSTDAGTRPARTFTPRPRPALMADKAGVLAARNLGIRAASAEFIAFLDADDLWHPEKLKRQMACFKARPELEICVTWVQNFWGSQSDVQLNRSKYRTVPATSAAT